MSTVDPDAERRARAARVPTGGELVLPGILVLLGGGALAASITTMSQDPGSDGMTLRPVLLVMCAVGSMIGALCAVGGMILWTRLSIRNPRLLGLAAPIALGLIGAGFGLLATFGSPPLAVALVGAGVVLGILALLVRQRRSARADLDDEIMRSSDPVTGEVTNQGYSHFGDSARILTTVTYAFSDAQGTRRFVRRSAVIEAENPLVEGERVDVWFDRQDPSDERRIVVRRRPRG